LEERKCPNVGDHLKHHRGSAEDIRYLQEAGDGVLLEISDGALVVGQALKDIFEGKVLE
jgi:hypothetical protein